MRRYNTGYCKKRLLSLCMLLSFIQLSAQTDMDAIMMTKNNFCTGLMYNSSNWTDYWEGTLKRNNENLGTVSTKMYAVMGNYGVSDKLNLLFGLPYVQTKASEGTLHGLKGFQDISLWIKWMPVEKKLGRGVFSVYGIGGLSFPTTNYVADFLPLSIGLHSTNLSLRGMVDYQIGKWFATVSGTYVVRSNIKIDRNSYYTTEQHITNEVSMPDASNVQLRTGYRSGRMIAEAIINNWTTLGGFDITRNNMPFPSNKMNATTAGINIKYNIQAVDGLALIGGGSITLAGRNIGQAGSINGGVFYILDFSHKAKKTTQSAQPVKAK
ncbi:MAG: hypothetical protein Q8R50_03100 [Sediminibacterium sp.]|nr:hypothetical protein [Sediminibacterium sp.]